MLVYRGRYTAVYKSRLRMPDGRYVDYDVVKQNPAAVILPFLDDDTVVMIREYRPLVKEWLYQLPAGTIEKGDKPIERARAELEEEAGYSSSNLEYLFKSYPTPGRTTETTYYFMATKLKKTRQSLEKDEMITVKLVRFSKAMQMVKENRIRNGNSIQALLYYDRFVR
ncbi:MAG: NUDIX hydrolase [Candidatus Micrarchaeota archaeon]|nr:NUDIX hydrolase [Candidatus Micrarchaeota archaeon]MDE1824495.1 NUDIX hydrolase [Candidatus Micrarchaeota archaeon]MDE1849127.1 NUDIX hydrolase [Candidatus Micrarchaeota archaeon]